MKKYFFLPVLVSIIVSSGCGISQNEPTQGVQEESKQVQESKEKIITWCDKVGMEGQKEIFHEGKLWISSEYFNGMNHAPTIRHFCREDKEFFSLEMSEWDDTTSTHYGKLISGKSKNSFSVTSTNKDPEVKLIEEKNKNNINQIWFTLDGKTFMYDENPDKFSKI